MKRHQAFTLIELLVVITIIAILAMASIPVFSKMVERARATECKNNLQSIGKGIVMYLGDNDDSMFSQNSTETWPVLLQGKYVTDWKLFRSPFDKVTATRPKTVTTPVPVSYGISEKVFDTFKAKWKNKSDSSVIMAAAAVDPSVTGKEVAFPATAISTSNVKISAGSTGPSLGTHQSRLNINVLFADGHVENMDCKQYSDNSTDLGKARWDPMYETP